jgi:23S rRNA pseudouridine2604 synthase
MNINLKGLPVGDWRELTQQEQEEIYKLVAKSSSEQSEKKKSAIKKSVKTQEISKPKTASKSATAKSKTFKPASGKPKIKQDQANDWFKSNSPNRRSTKPTKGRSGAPAAKTKSPKR